MFRPFLIASLFCATPMFADAEQDAAYIVGQTVTKPIFEAALTAQREIIIAAIAHDMAQNGLNLSNPDRFFDILMEEFIDEFTATMQLQSTVLYQELFSEAELAGIANFYKTPAGQALVANTPTLVGEGARMGQAAGEAAGANVGDRIEARFKAEGIELFDDPSKMEKLFNLLK